ncbi:hypothetical protein [uncultured Thalassospira sp.]|uniref:capsid assembly protein n=1 Tax=uncultured Thalassospira sp. TaxID=404382 RepID=UPI0030DCF805|tara:strand:- start:16494 stop:17318 length:825 start_codon:yes stop_codon:yes gene_type:complete
MAENTHDVVVGQGRDAGGGNGARAPVVAGEVATMVTPQAGNILNAAAGAPLQHGAGGDDLGAVGGAVDFAPTTAEPQNAPAPAFQIPGPDSPDAERQAFYAALGVPDSPAGYDIRGVEDLGGVDEALNARLHEAGFTGSQAQLVYDLATEILTPMVAQVQTAARMAEMQGQLAAEFGGAEQWAKLAPRLASWGQKHLPDAYDAMAQTPEGVRALYRLMQGGGEPGLAGNHAGQTGVDPQNDIQKLMNDPRYWRDRNPAIVARVQAAFDRLHLGE